MRYTNAGTVLEVLGRARASVRLSPPRRLWLRMLRARVLAVGGGDAAPALPLAASAEGGGAAAAASSKSSSSSAAASTRSRGSTVHSQVMCMACSNVHPLHVSSLMACGLHS